MKNIILDIQAFDISSPPSYIYNASNPTDTTLIKDPRFGGTSFVARVTLNEPYIRPNMQPFGIETVMENREYVSYATELLIENTSGADLSIKFISSSEEKEYLMDNTKFQGIQIATSKTISNPALPMTKYLIIDILNGSPTNSLKISLLNYYKTEQYYWN